MKTLTQFTQLLNNKFTKKNVIAPVESSSTASQAYTKGKKFFYNNILYKATADIAKDGLIVPDTNCTPADNIIDDVDELSSQMQTLTNQSNDMVNVLGAKNLLPNNAVSKTVNGITFTVNSDGSIGISSTNSETNGSYSVSDEFLLKKGSYKLSRGKHSTPCPSLYIAKASDFSLIAELTTDSGTEEISFTLDADVKVKCWMWYIANNAYNTTFYPMIRPASITDDTYVPYSMTNREMTPYVQAISNPNLLDNPWFTVNQRGISSLSAVGYTADRWKIYATGLTFTQNSNKSITLERGASEAVTSPQFIQFIEDEVLAFLDGKTVTLSALINGVVYSATSVIDASQNTFACNISIATGISLYIRIIPTGNPKAFVCFNLSGTSAMTLSNIKAVKLELGSVSTLAMDTTPNYATELLKCQRYFFRASATILNGFIFSSTVARFNMNNPKMRTNPSITIDNYTDPQIISNSNTYRLSDGNITPVNTDNGVLLYVNSSNMPINETATLKVNSAVISLSADL